LFGEQALQVELRSVRRLATTVAGALAGALAGFIVACAIVVLGAGVFWIFIFGDDEWPAAAENGLVAVAGIVWIAAMAAGAIIGWRSSTKLATE
jgi:hypothetical protein